MIKSEYRSLGDMFESKDEGDVELATAIFCNMNIDEVSQFLTEWGRLNGTYHNTLPPEAFGHLLKLNDMNNAQRRF